MLPPQTHDVYEVFDEHEPSLTSLARLVRDALAHLYDAAYLQTHPLADLVRSAHAVSISMVGIALRQSLLDAIESLRPKPGTPASAKVFRRYRILEMRYIEGLDALEIQEQTAVSRSEYYREHHEALGAVTTIVQERWRLPRQSGELSEPEVSSELKRDELARREAEELRTHMRVERLDARQVLGEVVELLQPFANLKDVEVDVRPLVRIGPIRADRVVLRQAFLSVLRQSIDCASPGLLEVRVTSEAEGVKIVMTARPSRLLGEEDGSLDLGLSLALVEGLRGRLDVSRVEAGWTLTMSFPSQPFPRLLVVDNNADFIALVARYLARENWAVLGVSQPDQAIEVARDVRPNVVLLDVMMPGHDGWDLLMKLRSIDETREIPVVICSILDEPQLASSLGANGYLPKPVSQVELMQALAPWCGGKPEEA